MFWLIATVPGFMTGIVMAMLGYGVKDVQFWIVLGCVAFMSAAINTIRGN